MWDFFQINKVLSLEWGRRIVKNIFKLNPKVVDEIDKNHQPIKAKIQGPYVAVQMRLGDKKTENELKNVSEYISAVENLGLEQKQLNIFVSSDNQSAVDEFIQQSKPHWQVFRIDQPLFITQNKSILLWQGHHQRQFNVLPAQSRRNATITLLAELEMFKGAEHVVCTISSNLCLLIQLLREQSFETVHSLDKPDRHWVAYKELLEQL